MDNENKQDGAEPTPASAGSVAGEPMAWAVTLADGEHIYDVYAIEEEAKAIDEAVTGNHGVIPLYRSPALTDAERIAIEHGIAALLSDEEVFGWDSTPHAATLRSLRERLK